MKEIRTKKIKSKKEKKDKIRYSIYNYMFNNSEDEYASILNNIKRVIDVSKI